ncbi:MAG TPA: hypothetical protein VM487_04115 [Phycisphaerae bacterium]|nr:hypothetical protein [Phycisphaerae bacterium]
MTIDSDDIPTADKPSEAARTDDASASTRRSSRATQTPPPTPDKQPSAAIPGDRTAGLVKEIKGTLAELAARELAAQRRERELERQYQRMHELAYRSVRQELEKVRNRLEARSKALDAQAVELATRSAQLDQLEEALAAREQDQEGKRRKLEQSIKGLRRREDAERAQREESRRTLLQRVKVIRKREADLAYRIRAARDQITGERDELTQQAESIRAQLAELEARRQALDAVGDEHAQNAAEAQARAAQLERQQAESEQAREGLERAKQDVEQQRRKLDKNRNALDRQARELREQQHQVVREQEEIEARRRTLQQERTDLQERTQRLDNRERQQHEQATTLDATAANLRELERDLNALQESIDPLRRQALEAEEEARRQRAEAEQEARRQRDEATAIREQLEARDAESRQTALRLEVERQELEREQALLTRTRDELAQSREQAEQESERVRAKIRERVRQLKLAEQSLLAAPARWWLRSGILATLVAAPTFVGWLAWDTPRYRSSATLLIDSQRGPATAVAAEHVARILSPGRMESTLRDPELAESWAAALADRRISVTPAEDRPALELAVTTPDSVVAGHLARAAAEGYRDQVNSAPAEPRPASFVADLIERRASVEGELADWHAHRPASADALKDLADQPQRDNCQAQVQQLQADYVQVTQSLEAERQARESLLAQDTPRGNVAADAYEHALAADAVYQEDLKELEAEARKYLTELAIAMVLLVDPLAELRKAARSLATTLTEQKELKPPPTVLAVLEACGTQAETFDEESAEFTQAWERRRQALERWEMEDGVVGLVRQQEAAADVARRFLERARALVGQLGTHVEGLAGEGSSGTREIVVAAVLRADLGRLSQRLATLTEATAATDVTVNFRLNAHDRQLRGIRTRLQTRREAICRQMDEQADRQASSRHTERLAELANTVGELEQQREDLLLGLVGKLEELRSLDEQLLERQRVETDVRQADAAIERLATQLTRLDAALEQARHGGPRPDRIQQDIPIHEEQTAGVHRYRNAGLAAAGVFATAWLISLLMILKNPLRPRETPFDTELIETPPTEAP